MKTWPSFASLVTNEPAPMKQSSPMLIMWPIVELIPIKHLFPIVVFPAILASEVINNDHQ